MRLAHHPGALERLRRPTPEEPLRLFVSGCLPWRPCGVDGSDYGLHAPLREMLSLPTVSVASFCPEDFAMGTPRTMPDIHGGDGFAVPSDGARDCSTYPFENSTLDVAARRAKAGDGKQRMMPVEREPKGFSDARCNSPRRRRRTARW